MKHGSWLPWLPASLPPSLSFCISCLLHFPSCYTSMTSLQNADGARWLISSLYLYHQAIIYILGFTPGNLDSPSFPSLSVHISCQTTLTEAETLYLTRSPPKMLGKITYILQHHHLFKTASSNQAYLTSLTSRRSLVSICH